MGIDRRGPIGLFDSGFGGLTVLKEIRQLLPEYDYLYLGDNARAPYGSRSYNTIYRYTRDAVGYLFDKGCPLVILACNTASAKALRTLQQKDLAHSEDPSRRILGVIRPTVESLGEFTRTGCVGVVATRGTVSSNSYPLEVSHVFPQVQVFQHACPMWVSLVENNEIGDTLGTNFFIERDLQALLVQEPKIDTVLLGCTHFPILKDRIAALLPSGISLLCQGAVVARSLKQYLERHLEMNIRLSRNGDIEYYTTGEKQDFISMGSLFLGDDLNPSLVHHATLARREEL